METDFVTLSDGRTFSLPGYGSLTPDQQSQRLAQLERQLRVATAAQRVGEANDGYRTGVGVLDSATEAFDEFRRNADFGLGDYAGAAGSYIDSYFADPGADPMEGLGFLERRDALRMAQDQDAEEFLPGFVDDTASLAGVLASPGGLYKAGLKPALAGGALIGGLEGLGNSEGENLTDVAVDTAEGSALGTAVGGLSDLFLSKIVGGGARKLFAEENSGQRFDELETLGIPPSVGAIGNRNAAGLENAFAESPVSGTLGRVLDATGIVPGTSASLKQQQQVEALDRALGEKVTSSMVASGDQIAQTDSALAPYLREVAQNNLARGKDEISNLEATFLPKVPRNTPVNITRTRGIPQAMLANNNSADLAERTQSEIDTILKNKRTPVNTTRDAQLNGALGRIDGQLGQIDSQLAAMSDKSTPQAKALMRTREKLVQDRQKTLTLIDNNKGPAFAALREDRNMIGANVGEGLANRDSSMLYSAITRDLETAAARVGGPNARKAFRDMTRREREIFLSAELIKPLATQKGAAGNIPYLKAALMKGNDAELDALMSRLNPSELGTFRANALHMLGRNTKDDPFVPSQFAGNWQRMTEDAKAKLVPNPQQRALVEAVAGVAESFTARGMASNRSNSANAAGVLAFMGASVANPAKIMTFLTSVGGVDRVVASRALAEAVAGKPTNLGQLVRRAIMRTATHGDAAEILFGEEGGQP